ncbi:MAG: hypothetical protein JXJ22_15260 [Bacteroidales bacterium]|nr:hypothetical protein [Bacteroidales bacterium]
MEYYKIYFQKNIKRITYILFIFSLVAVFFDEISNHNKYPVWISWLNKGLITLTLILLFLSITKGIKVQHSFILYVYLFTLNIYFPGFVGNEQLRISIITSFTNLGACIIYIFVAGIIGAGIHVLVLGGINVLFIILLVLINHASVKDSMYFDPITILMFIFTSVLIYIMFRQIEKSLIENENNKQMISKQEKELLSVKINEERNRNYFLSMIQSENDLFVSKIITKLSTISQRESEPERIKQIADLKQLCILQGYKTIKSGNAKWHKETNSDFIASLKRTYPELTQKEQHICSLLRIKLNSKEIADKLDMSIETIKWYRKRIRKKLNINDNKNLTDFLSTF